ncbi:hypothetical protein [Noviherbaspirillum pedocola]|uniref:RHS repeat protein n=1 Tax=Noviherbaspirillum pedocola TaxID=2801341 RepID=A0A934SZ92_9BURK|nr:hypothetical protein [Noviherbaspirillum pedocola]MBK4738442.1 hypothetical protein [Noviherbaspirillum pedocola]
MQNNQLRNDSNGRLTEVTDTAAGLVRITIGYDANGNRRRIATDMQAMLGRQGRSIACDLNKNRISDA